MTSAVAQKLLFVFPLHVNLRNGPPRYTAQDIANATGWSLGDIRPCVAFKTTDTVTWRGVLQVKSQITICKGLGVLVGDVHGWVAG